MAHIARDCGRGMHFDGSADEDILENDNVFCREIILFFEKKFRICKKRDGFKEFDLAFQFGNSSKVANFIENSGNGE